MQAQKQHLRTKSRHKSQATGPENNTRVWKPAFWPISTVYMSLGELGKENLEFEGKLLLRNDFLSPESRTQVQNLREEREHDVGPPGELPARKVWRHPGLTAHRSTLVPCGLTTHQLSVVWS